MPTCVDFKSYRLYGQGAGQERRIVELVSRAKGERMVRSKTAQAGLDWDGVTLCFELIGASSASAVPTFVPRAKSAGVEIDPSNAVFSKAELMAIAGRKFKHGRSRTASMNDLQREARAKRIYESSVLRNGYAVKVGPEDIVERATNKFNAWQQLGPALQELVREVAVL